MSETKVLKIYLKTWRKLRRQIKGRKNETMADYMDRVLVTVDGVQKLWDMRK